MRVDEADADALEELTLLDPTLLDDSPDRLVRGARAQVWYRGERPEHHREDNQQRPYSLDFRLDHCPDSSQRVLASTPAGLFHRENRAKRPTVFKDTSGERPKD